jgi:hypothetical protein
VRVRIWEKGGSFSSGFIIRTANRNLLVAMPGRDEAVEFRHNLGDWISQEGHMISFEFGYQPPTTRTALWLISKSAA